MKNSGPIRVTADQVQAYRDKQQAKRHERARQPKARAPQRRPGEMGERQAKNILKYRSGGWCEISIPGTCTGRGLDFSHRLNQSQGGLWLPSHGLYACRRCHLLLTTPPKGRRAEFLRNGWSVIGGTDPLTVHTIRVLLAHWDDETRVREWVLLDNRGGWTATDTHEHKGAA